VLGRPRASADLIVQIFGRRLNEHKSCRKLDTDDCCGQYYEHRSRSIVPRELKKKKRCLTLLSFNQWDSVWEGSGVQGEQAENVR